MKLTFKKRFKKLVTQLAFLFVILFVFRFIYGYTITVNGPINSPQIFDQISIIKNNYASKEYKTRSTTVDRPSVKVDQKYEKIAEIKTVTSDFEQEEKLARTTIESFNALIQFEKKNGNSGYRKLNLVIGVPPNNFDSLYAQLIEIGTVRAKQITKKDKTNEYKELNAKKQSLEKTRASLIDLKSKGGKIEEYMGLENRILEIEQQLQGLGVSLGDYDDENEFCTVQFYLNEGKTIDATKIGLLQRVKVALEWTVKMYLKLMACLFFLVFFAYLFLTIVEKLKIMERLFNKKE